MHCAGARSLRRRVLFRLATPPITAVRNTGAAGSAPDVKRAGVVSRPDAPLLQNPELTKDVLPMDIVANVAGMGCPKARNATSLECP